MILLEYHGKGITTEAVQYVVDYGFNFMRLHSIKGVIDTEKKLLKKYFKNVAL
jgi:ribosomal-protein-alanine N-acetyltransferase